MRKKRIIIAGIVGVSILSVYIFRYEIAQGLLDFSPVKEQTNPLIQQALMDHAMTSIRDKVDLNAFQKAAVSLLGKRKKSENER